MQRLVSMQEAAAPWVEVARDGLRTGALASAATTATLAWLGQRSDRAPAGPLNAVSHILWGERAAEQDGLSAKYTAAGVGLNALAVSGWSLVHALLFRRRAPKSIARALAGGALVSGLAYWVDYHVVPDRLAPGFEKRLEGRELLAVYSVLALCFAFGSRARV